nr:hypothetical protein [Eubacterium sp.]
MKKIYTFFLLGQLLLYSIIFSKSLYEVYGLNHIGDTSLFGYKIEEMTPDVMSELYDNLIKEKADVQIIKMPISKERPEITNYEIYHTNIASVFRFVGLSDNQYQYYDLQKEDFVDGTGVFYTSLSEKTVQNICNKIGIEVTKYEEDSYTSIKTILLANGVDLLILLIVTFGVIVVYVISRNKENAVKILLGYSGKKIVGARAKETAFIELISGGLVWLGNIIYYGIQGKWSLFFGASMLMFLAIMAGVNVLLIFLTSKLLNRTNVVSAIKNKMYSPVLDHVIQGVKIVLCIIVSVSISGMLNYQQKIADVEEQMGRYKELNDFYCSYGYNSDEYDKLSGDDARYLETAQKVKEMYQQNQETAYVMQDCVLTAISEGTGMSEEDFYGMSREELFASYVNNYVIVNRKYLEEYISVEITSGKIDDAGYTILVPERYRSVEEDVREQYRLVIEEKVLADNYYGKKENITIDNEDINLVYIKDDYSVRLLSDLQYDSIMDMEIKSPIIILDTGEFASSMYMDMLSNCQMAFRLGDREEFSAMIHKMGLEKIFSARTMMAPFMETISGYQFVMQQSSLFVVLFTITLLFIIYISNHIHLSVNAKQYGVRYEMGHSNTKILCADILVSGMLCLVGIVFVIVKMDIRAYVVFVGIDFVTLWVLYRIRVVEQIYKILNGGC